MAELLKDKVAWIIALAILLSLAAHEAKHKDDVLECVEANASEMSAHKARDYCEDIVSEHEQYERDRRRESRY